jgi:ribose transport system substrate-binding protein
MQTSSSALIACAMIAFGALPVAPAAADAVADAKAAVAKYAGPQTTWKGPTKGPKPEAGKKIVILSGDEKKPLGLRSHPQGRSIPSGDRLRAD